jgi:hypothetical protein
VAGGVLAGIGSAPENVIIVSQSVERELPWSWHRSLGWRGQFERVHRWHQRLIAATSREDAEDFLYAFFQNCYHLRYWLGPPEFDPTQVERLLEDHVELRLCRDICNMTKHYELSKPPATWREPSVVREYVGAGSGWFEDDSILVVLSQGHQYDALDLASRCLEIWEDFLRGAMRGPNQT